MNARRLTLTALAALCALAGALLLCGAPAFAARGYVFEGSFGSEGSEAGKLKDPAGVAVNDSTGLEPAAGDVYVVDEGNNRVERFSSTGSYLGQFNGSGTYEDLEEAVKVKIGTAAPTGAFSTPEGIAVDNSTDPLDPSAGDVYVTDAGNDVIDKFSATGAYLGQISTSPGGGGFPVVDGVAVDPSGVVWVYAGPPSAENGGEIYNYSDNQPNEPIASRHSDAQGYVRPGFAVDSEDNLYVTHFNGRVVAKLNSAGESTTPGKEEALDGRYGVTGIAVDLSNNDVYLDGGGSVSELAANGSPIDEFGSEHLTGGSGVAVNASSETVYVADATSDRVDSFVSATLPDVTTEAPTGVTASTAVLRGAVNPDGIAVSQCEFEWGTEPGVYPHTVACSALPGSGTEPVAVSAEITGLTPNTAYRYRLVAANATDKGVSNYGVEEPFFSAGPPAIDAESSLGVGSSHATLSAQIDPGGYATHYHFEYDTTEYNSPVSHGTSVPIPDGEIAPGFSDRAVNVNVKGLPASTAYHYRVVASSECEPIKEPGHQCVVDGSDQTFTTLPPALIEGSTVSEVTSSSATLEAQINPLGSSTTCEFQYVTVAGFQATGYATASSVPCPADLGEGEADVPADVHLQGLAVGTVYRYRAIAHNALGTVEGEPNEEHQEVAHTFTTQTVGPFALPDGRQWEMVSPADKHGALILPLGSEGPIQSSAAGSAMTYQAASPTESEPQGNPLSVQVLSVRGSDGWSSRDMTLPHATAIGIVEGNGTEYRAFSEDLSHAVVQQWGSFLACRSAEGVAQPCLSEEASEQTPFLASSYVDGNPSEPCLPPAMSCYEPLVTGVPGVADVPEGTVFGPPTTDPFTGPSFVGATPDLKHVVLRSEPGVALSKEGGNLYEWSADKPPTERLAPVSVLPDKNGEGGGPAEGDLGSEKDVRNAISDDGSRVFWSSGSSVGGPLYVRDLMKGETLRVDQGDGTFQDASSNGEREFYTEGGTLFECHIVESASGELECEDGGVELGSGVLGSIPGVSEDGSWVYFVATDVLAEGALSGAPNLYVRYGGTTSLVAVLSLNRDSHDWGGEAGESQTLTARVAPDGRWLAFMSARSLTGYDNRDALSGEPDEEVYLYHAEISPSGALGAGDLVCASCDPTGARPVGAVDGGGVHPIVDTEEEWGGSWLAANVPAWQPYKLSSAVYQPRYLSDSGRLFFNAHDPLVPRAVNGNWDVYEYEPEGVGPSGAVCGPAVDSGSEVFRQALTVEVEGREVDESAGCVGLLSSGESAHESAFLDASETGGDVFFLTAAKLARQDTDDALDVYDAHECRGEAPCFPASAAEPSPCATEASCKPAPESQPAIFGSGPSETFTGAGDLAPLGVAPKTVAKKAVKCKKGFAKNKKGKCMAKKAKKNAKNSDRRAGR
jgi:hypothetical protein